jgi:hypothetical protein
MHATEKSLRYQALSKLKRMEQDGTKPAVIERLRRSMQTTRGGVQKGKVFRARKPL